MTLVQILDPWHPDAFIGTAAEGVFKSDERRRTVWALEDDHGNVIAIVPDDQVEAVRTRLGQV